MKTSWFKPVRIWLLLNSALMDNHGKKPKWTNSGNSYLSVLHLGSEATNEGFPSCCTLESLATSITIQSMLLMVHCVQSNHYN